MYVGQEGRKMYCYHNTNSLSPQKKEKRKQILRGNYLINQKVRVPVS